MHPPCVANCTPIPFHCHLARGVSCCLSIAPCDPIPFFRYLDRVNKEDNLARRMAPPTPATDCRGPRPRYEQPASPEVPLNPMPRLGGVFQTPAEQTVSRLIANYVVTVPGSRTLTIDILA